MKIWLIKHKGANWWGNFLHEREIEFPDGEKIYSQNCFYRKKDAVKYRNSGRYHEFFEVVSAEIT